MYHQKYTVTTSGGGGAPGTRQNGAATNQFGNSRSAPNRTNHSSFDGAQQPFQSNSKASGYGNGGGANGGSASPMRSPPPAELQRRESLVKPTWANISPGQVPSSTFDELVSSAHNNGQHDGGGGGPQNGYAEGEPQSELGMLSNKLLAKNGLNQRQKRREVELYDIFGKVRMATEAEPVAGWVGNEGGKCSPFVRGRSSSETEFAGKSQNWLDFPVVFHKLARRRRNAGQLGVARPMKGATRGRNQGRGREVESGIQCQ